MKRVLVTGAGGFIGRHCLSRLLQDGFEVHAMGRRRHTVPGVTWHPADVLDACHRRSVVMTVEPSHLLHLAWSTDHGVFWSDPSNLDWAAATLDLASVFTARGGTRLLVAGSCAEYDWSAAEDRFHESKSACRPSTFYGQAKHSTQGLLAAYASEVGLSFSWGVLFFLMGPGEKRERLVPSVITAILDGRPAALSAGTQVRDFVDVRDAAHAMVALLQSDVRGRVNVGTGRGVAVADVANRIGIVLGHPELLDFGARALPLHEPRRVVADVTRLTTEVGYLPSRTLDESIAAAVEWWQAPGRRTQKDELD